MYICPTCHRGFKNEEIVAKHSLQCWREHNPNHITKPAPCKGNTTKRQFNKEVMSFFAQFRKD